MSPYKLSEIVKERSTPGILIFNLQGQLLYSNQEAQEIQAVLQTGEAGLMCGPGEIYNLCRQSKRESDISYAAQGDAPGYPVLSDAQGLTYALRTFLIDDHGAGSPESHILVLIERVVEHRKVDIEKARREFLLTKREAEVISLICQGLSNKEISGKKFIAEHTVKVHVKNIMKKMKAGSRNEICALLK